jgi:cyclophilin family peptidyl-prolyl cis-trans isomerase
MFLRSSHARAIAAPLALVALAALSACGGSGDDSGGGTPTASVSSISVAATRYGQPALVTINGSGLDVSLAVASNACTGMTLLTTAPTVSNSTTAYYSCTVAGALTGTVTAKSNRTLVGTSPAFTVPQPVVTMAVSNGSGVNGNVTFTLAADKAPNTVSNFLSYVNSGFYNGVIFHRVVPGFIIQAGAYAAPIANQVALAAATPKATSTNITLEKTGLSNVTWSVAMANTGSTTNPASQANSQFFVNLANNTNLDGGYAVFGAMTAGTTVAQAIVSAPSVCSFNNAAGSTDCLPVPNVVINSATQTQ